MDEPVTDELSFRDQSVAGEREFMVWRSSKGQIANLNVYTFCVMGAAAVLYLFPLNLALVGLALIGGVALWEYLVVWCTRYELTNQTLTYRYGVLSPQSRPLQLYRVEDSGVSEPFDYRMFGRGNVQILSSDRDTPKLTLTAIKRPREVEVLLRKHYEIMRRSRGTRVIE